MLQTCVLPTIPLPVIQKREYDPKDPDPCRGCCDCCNYVAVSISRPRSFRDFDELYWFLLHEKVWVYVDEENDWYVQFNTPCSELRDKRCGIYPRRPKVCREYEVHDCTTYGEGEAEKFLFKCPEDLFAYLKKRRPKMYAQIATYYDPVKGKQDPGVACRPYPSRPKNGKNGRRKLA
jgi:Fe-S-cluster containining protein